MNDQVPNRCVSLLKRDGAQLGCSYDCWKRKLMIITLDPPAESILLTDGKDFPAKGGHLQLPLPYIKPYHSTITP